MEQQLTPWFVNGETPARPGVYQVDSTVGPRAWAKWNGRKWCWRRQSFRAAETDRVPTSRQVTRWRGLAQDPSAKP